MPRAGARRRATSAIAHSASVSAPTATGTAPARAARGRTPPRRNRFHDGEHNVAGGVELKSPGARDEELAHACQHCRGRPVRVGAARTRPRPGERLRPRRGPHADRGKREADERPAGEGDEGQADGPPPSTRARESSVEASQYLFGARSPLEMHAGIPMPPRTAPATASRRCCDSARRRAPTEARGPGGIAGRTVPPVQLDLGRLGGNAGQLCELLQETPHQPGVILRSDAIVEIPPGRDARHLPPRTAGLGHPGPFWR